MTYNYPRGTVIGTYRLPAVDGYSTVLKCWFTGTRYIFEGGKWGTHAIETTDRRRVRAHWAGYCSSVMGRTVKPATLRFPAEVK